MLKPVLISAVTRTFESIFANKFETASTSIKYASKLAAKNYNDNDGSTSVTKASSM